MTITLVNEALALILAEVTGIEATFALPPPSLDTAALPACYILTGGGSDTYETDDFDSEDRIYRIQIAVVPRGQASAEVRETRCRALIHSVKNKLKSYTNLERTPFVRNMRVQGDSGIVVLPEYGAKYVGFEVRVNVTELIHKTYED